MDARKHKLNEGNPKIDGHRNKKFSIQRVEILVELSSLPASNVTSLAKRVNRLRPSTSRCLQSMKKMGWVTQDRVMIKITDEGRSFLEEVIAARELAADLAYERLEEVSPRKLTK